jgi:hypothetical protein
MWMDSSGENRNLVHRDCCMCVYERESARTRERERERERERDDDDDDDLDDVVLGKSTKRGGREKKKKTCSAGMILLT